MLPPASIDERATALRVMRAATPLLLLLDYDGTLVPIASTPPEARPDDALLRLLDRLTRRPGTHVHIVSGRDSEVLDTWLGRLPLGLHAEHGASSRRGSAWSPRVPLDDTWRDEALGILRTFTDATPGSLIEQKPLGMSWHYRLADAALGTHQAARLHRRLTEALARAPVDVTSGQLVVELRPRGAHKGLVVAPLLDALPPTTLAVAFGDDRTDEDLFAALPTSGLSFRVGAGPSQARLRLTSSDDVRSLLTALVDGEAR